MKSQPIEINRNYVINITGKELKHSYPSSKAQFNVSFSIGMIENVRLHLEVLHLLDLLCSSILIAWFVLSFNFHSSLIMDYINHVSALVTKYKSKT